MHHRNSVHSQYSQSKSDVKFGTNFCARHQRSSGRRGSHVPITGKTLKSFADALLFMSPSSSPRKHVGSKQWKSSTPQGNTSLPSAPFPVDGSSGMISVRIDSSKTSKPGRRCTRQSWLPVTSKTSAFQSVFHGSQTASGTSECQITHCVWQ